MKWEASRIRVSRRSALQIAGGIAAALALQPGGRAQAGSAPPVAVVGGGVVGLQVARVFAERGYPVTVYAADVTPGTTSDVAAAVIFPHLAPPTPEVLEAVRLTNAYYDSLVDAGAGVYRRTLTLAVDAREDAEPEVLPFAPLYKDFRELAVDEIPGGYKYGWSIGTYFVDSRVFMPYLMRLLLDLGVNIRVRRFASHADLIALPEPIVAVCAGLGAAQLLDDATVYPVKGQLVTVNPVSLVDPIIHDGAHIFPRDDSAVLGGTNEENVYDLAISEETTQKILAVNRRILPSLSRDQVIGVRAGLRPFRTGGPRVERQSSDGKLFLYDYGHGGSGWTLAPGCAEQVLRLVTQGN